MSQQNRLQVEQIWALAVYQTKAGNFCHCATQCLSVDTPTENGDLEKIWSHIPADSCFLCPLGWWTRYFCTETLKYRGNLLRLLVLFPLQKKGFKRSPNGGICHPTDKENDWSKLQQLLWKYEVKKCQCCVMDLLQVTKRGNFDWKRNYGRNIKCQLSETLKTYLFLSTD